MLVDEGLHGLERRSSSAWAKYALALRRISLAWRSSRTSRSSCLDPLLLRRSSARRAGPGRARPAAPSGAASRAEQPILAAIDRIAVILRGVLVLVLENHPDRPLADLW